MLTLYTFVTGLNLGINLSTLALLPFTLLFLSRIQRQLIVDVSRISSNPKKIREKPPVPRIARGDSSIMTDRARIYSSEDDVSSKKQISRIHEPLPPVLVKKKRRKRKKVNLGREGGPAALERVKYPKHRDGDPVYKIKMSRLLERKGDSPSG